MSEAEDPRPMTNAERQRALRTRRVKAGMEQLHGWISTSTAKQLKRYQAQHGLTLDAALARLLNPNQERK